MTFGWQKLVDWYYDPTVFSVGVTLLPFALTLGMLERRFSGGGRQYHGPRSDA